MLNVEYRDYQIERQSPFLVYGSDTNVMPQEVKWASANTVSQLLSQHPNTMLQFRPDQLVAAMNKGWVVMAFTEGMQVVGFAQFWQYGFKENGQEILEFGSWVSTVKGCGARILKKAIQLGKEIAPTSQLIAIVEEKNTKAQSILVRVGAKEIGHKLSPVIRKVEGEAAFMKIFDITDAKEAYEYEKVMAKK